MNLIAAEAATHGIQLPANLFLNISLPAGASKSLTLGVRARALSVKARPGDLVIPGKVELAEISGSDTFIHVDSQIGKVIAQLTGVHEFDLGAQITLHLNPAQVYIFDQSGDLLVAPARPGEWSA